MRPLLMFLAVIAFGPPAHAHELWIEPLAYSVAPDGVIEAQIVNGQDFGGTGSPGLNIRYFPKDFTRFEVTLGDTVVAVSGRTGDNPALSAAPLGDGLHVLVYETTRATVTYAELEKFLAFAGHKDLATSIGQDVAEAHAARGLPQADFRESYYRYSKALVAVGTGVGADRNVGLETELIAQANPATDDLSSGMPVLLLYQGQPRANAQVELFSKAQDGTVTLTLHRTDGEGRALLPVVPGHSYLVNAVVLREPRDPTGDPAPVWETLWAALTFAVP